jgi:pimeloyl-ACP methyl ester carboxylesterase
VIDYVADAVSLLERAAVAEPAAIYGHSLGAMVAAAAAAQLPDRVRAVVLEDPPFETMGSRIRQTRLHSFFSGMRPLAGSVRPVAELARDVAKLTFVDPQTGAVTRLGDVRDAASIRFTARCLRRLDPAALEPIVAGRWLEGYDRDDVLRCIACPALLLQADPTAGGMLSEDDAARFEGLVADGSRVSFPNAGHVLHWERTEAARNVVTAFLESLE